jgi:hypothetical protein
MPVLRTFTGGCHCGLVRFETTLDLDNVVSCNCSICSKKGLVLAFVPAERFALRAGEDQLAEYLFHKKVIRHQFCPVCGVEPFARGNAPNGAATIAVNIRCLDDVDLAAAHVKPFDGRSV